MSAVRQAAIVAALEKCATSVDTDPGGGWAFTLVNGARLGARASIDDGWLVLEAPLGRGALPGVWSLLAWHATFPGGARFVPGPGGQGLAARAELCLDADVDVFERVREACDGLVAAKAATVHARPAAPASGPAVTADLPALCRETSFGGVERDGGVVVELAVPGAFHRAVVATRPDAGVVASVPLADAVAADAEPVADVCRQAFGVLCFRTGGVVRLVRAAAADVAGARFEVALGAAPCAAELEHALAALSVACRLATREAAVLRADKAVARTYLTQWELETTGGES
jgi:hypothetical protein